MLAVADAVEQWPEDAREAIVLRYWQEAKLSEIAEGGELVVSFGGLPVRNSQVAYGGITQHEVRDGKMKRDER